MSSSGQPKPWSEKGTGTSPMTGANRDVHQWSTQAMVREGNRDISNDWGQQGCAPVVNPSVGQRRARDISNDWGLQG